MELKIGPILTLALAAMLLAALVPSVLSMFYTVKSDTKNVEYGRDYNNSVIASDLNVTNSGSLQTIWRVLPVIMAIGALGILYGCIRLGYL